MKPDRAAPEQACSSALPVGEADPVLAPLLERARADHAMLGLLLSGSRGDDCGHADSDYDVVVVLTEAAYERRRTAGAALRQDSGDQGGRSLLTVHFTSPQQLAAAPSWRTYGFVASKVLFDRDGTVAAALQALSTIPEEQARQEARAWLDAYLNAFYRSMKAWHRADELGARLHAAHSADYLARALFALQRRWPPYHDRLAHHLGELDSQGWAPGYLAETFLALLRTADPARQLDLQRRVERLARERGFGPLLDEWARDIEWVQRPRTPG